MIVVSIKVKDNSNFGEVIGFSANFFDGAELDQVKGWIDRMVGEENELINTVIGEAN